jgi:hypothetical protein
LSEEQGSAEDFTAVRMGGGVHLLPGSLCFNDCIRSTCLDPPELIRVANRTSNALNSTGEAHKSRPWSEDHADAGAGQSVHHADGFRAEQCSDTRAVKSNGENAVRLFAPGVGSAAEEGGQGIEQVRFQVWRGNHRCMFTSVQRIRPMYARGEDTTSPRLRQVLSS